MPFINAAPKKLLDYVTRGDNMVFGFNMFKFCFDVPRFAEIVQKELHGTVDRYGFSCKVNFLNAVFRMEDDCNILYCSCPCEFSKGNPKLINDINRFEDACVNSDFCKTFGGVHAMKIMAKAINSTSPRRVKNALVDIAKKHVVNWLKFPGRPQEYLTPRRLPLAFIPRIPVPEIPCFQPSSPDPCHYGDSTDTDETNSSWDETEVLKFMRSLKRLKSEKKY